MKITCPHCNNEFELTDSGYQDILAQVKNKEFEKELNERLSAFREQSKTEKELEKSHAQAEFNKARNELEKQIQDLKNQLSNANQEKQLAVNAEKAQANDDIKSKEKEINDLKLQLQKAQSDIKSAVSEATAPLDKRISELQGQLTLAGKDKDLELQKQKEFYAANLKLKEEEISRLKEFRLRESTKMVGENLEVYCHEEFNKIRSTAFPRAYFDKDNDARSGSKGDFIFRDYDDEGNEYISIMFEMKNEMDTTATKHKNADFFKELDKDRKEKKCEYAVLVSMLEQDSNLYNQGIVDVSYQYEKMYVIRPQFFIPIISLLRNAAQNSVALRKQLLAIRNENIELETFEENLQKFKLDFGKNVENAKNKFDAAIEQIDKTINNLQKVKESLLGSGRHLSIANSKVEEVTIRKLTKGAPSVAERLKNIEKGK